MNVLETRNNLSRLVAVAEAGGEVVIARRGKPVARIVPVDEDGGRSAASFAAWLLRHHVPIRVARPIGAIDLQIAEERGAWNDPR
ncbi:type II toxin-antitoxin system prevent-host-death family antitoxin [Agromyces sp. H66]|uniref:type II toxin-antitoxin system Phd/YefM family antitoxin n=1 Tax=Agromyces sp. H66 TaxID=2529859 RepID=UPI001B7D7934|nr:type II toxin-antitoxin system prevent-host-death family antitoxin [Agromyces sp. H66]